MTTSALRVLHVESGHEWRVTRNQVSLLVRGLSANPSIEQAVATLARSRLAVEADAAGVSVIPLPWAAGTDPRTLRTLARHTRRRWDLFHAHDTHALRLLVYLSALEGSAARLIASRRVHGPPRSLWKWKRASLVLASSEPARAALIRAGLERSRVTVIPDGVDGTLLEPQEQGRLRAAAGAEPSHFLIGSLAALGADRDHASLIRAAALVAEQHPGARFALFGEGAERGRLESLIETLDLGGRVCLPGYLPEAGRSISDLDLFVMPSRTEELATGCLEAMWHGVPVIMMADADGRLRGRGIEPVRPGDPEKLAEAVGRFIVDPDHRARMAEAGRARARVHRAEAMVDSTLAAYESVLTGRQG